MNGELARIEASEKEKQRQQELKKKKTYFNTEDRFSVSFPDSWIQKYRIVETTLGDDFQTVYSFQYKLCDGKYYDVFLLVSRMMNKLFN